MATTTIVSVLDRAFPPDVRELERPPDALYLRGALPRVPGVAIVGTRDASQNGVAYAYELARDLAARGIAVWSGGANGIDRAAHDGALSVGGITVLVAGSGLDVPSPRSSGPLWRRVAKTGALVGIVPDRAEPRPWTFLARNGVLAAATCATVLVECPLKSGARSTTAHARRLGRPIFVVPQHPTSEYFAAFSVEIQLGGRLLHGASDLVDVCQRRSNRAATSGSIANEPLDESTQRVLDAIDIPRHPDELVELLELPFAEVQVALAKLVVSGRAVELESGTFGRIIAE